MSKLEKLEKRLLSRPKDFTWAEMTKFLNSKGYNLHNGKGSRRKFINSDKEIINLHEPHPENTLKKYVLDQVIEKLNLKG